MILQELKKRVQENREQNLPIEYIKIDIKEFLISYALDFIYNSPKWNELIFTGGTALKVLWNTARLSEDLDLDYTKSIDSEEFIADLVKYFNGLGIKDITTSARQNGKIITLKFPILKELGLIKNEKAESNFLYLKIDLAKNKYKEFETKTTPMTVNNMFFIIRSYDLETLFANKIAAILGRKDKLYKNKYDFKGRDFYDLIWFLQKDVVPNLKRLKKLLKTEQGIDVRNYKDVWRLLKNRTKEIDTKGIYEDMKNLIKEPEAVKQMSEHFLEMLEELLKKYSKIGIGNSSTTK